MAFKKLGKDLESIMRKLRGLPKIDKEVINAIIQDLQRVSMEWNLWNLWKNKHKLTEPK